MNESNEPTVMCVTTHITGFQSSKGRKQVQLGKLYDVEGKVIAQTGSTNQGAWMKNLDLKIGDRISIEATAHFEEKLYQYPITIRENYPTIADLRLSGAKNVAKVDDEVSKP
jgi:hypothetical protein